MGLEMIVHMQVMRALAKVSTIGKDGNMSGWRSVDHVPDVKHAS